MPAGANKARARARISPMLWATSRRALTRSHYLLRAQARRVSAANERTPRAFSSASPVRDTPCSARSSPPPHDRSWVCVISAAASTLFSIHRPRASSNRCARRNRVNAFSRPGTQSTVSQLRWAMRAPTASAATSNVVSALRRVFTSSASARSDARPPRHCRGAAAMQPVNAERPLRGRMLQERGTVVLQIRR